MSDSTDKNSIELTRDQYLSLLKISWLGNWMANAQKDGSPTGQPIEEYDDIHSHVLSYAKNFGLEKYVGDEDFGDGKLYESDAFDDLGLYDLTQQYDDGVFVQEFVNQLAERDFKRKYTQSDSERMSGEEYGKTIRGLARKWADELNSNWIENITLDR